MSRALETIITNDIDKIYKHSNICYRWDNIKKRYSLFKRFYC
jgi:hypothetical protein